MAEVLILPNKRYLRFDENARVDLLGLIKASSSTSPAPRRLTPRSTPCFEHPPGRPARSPPRPPLREGALAGIGRGDAQDLLRRTGIRADELEKLAWAGALASCHGFASKRLSRRTALWQAAEAARPAGALFETLPLDPASAPLPAMSSFAETVADYDATELTAGPHFMAYFRPALDARGIRTAADLAKGKDGEWVTTAGAVIVRQRPGTAKGFVFLSLEDETGIIQAIVRPDLFRENRALLVGSPALLVEGRLQTRDGTLSIKAEKFEALSIDPAIAFKSPQRPCSLPKEKPDGPRVQTPPSHDFR